MQRQARPRTEPAQDVIDELARRTGRPAEQVRTVYEEQLAILGSDATVTVYLPVRSAPESEGRLAS